MIGKIDKDGCLFIKRKGIFREQFCPYDSDVTSCGDWCPRFVEDIVFGQVTTCGCRVNLEIDEREYKKEIKCCPDKPLKKTY